MDFSDKLKKIGQPIVSEIMAHPFVKGIGDGHVPSDSLAFYVGQDYKYLQTYLKVYAAAIQKTDDADQIKLFGGQLNMLAQGESDAHKSFCEIAGIEYESLQHARVAPMTYLYNEHMYNSVRTGDLIDVIASLLPCPWTYAVIGNDWIAQGKATDDNPFKFWLDFYATDESDDQVLSNQFFDIIDKEAEKCSDQRLKVVEDRFLKSCELEWHFWDQAYYKQDWKFI